VPKSISLMSLLLATAASLSLLPGTAVAGSSGDSVERIATLHVPGQPLAVFDIGYVNQDGIYALADRSNGGVDFFDAATDKYLGRAGGFAGFNKTAGTKMAGPNGVVAVGAHEFWATDGDSSVKVIDLRAMKVVDSIPTNGKARADEIAYDPRDHLIVAVNNADSPPFATFISTRTRKVVGRLELPHATDGAEQPLYDPATKLVYLSIPVVDNVDANGAVAVINPRSHSLVKMMPVQKCMPAGLVLGPHGDLLLGCSDDSVDAGFSSHSIVMNARSGKIEADVPVGGSDEVWSDMRSHHYYLAAVANKGGPVLGVIDSLDYHVVAAIPTGPRAHSVAVDEKTGKVFVPIQANAATADCAEGCIAVFGPKGH
jgi:DNA-binding beta-propeller fold protein YncE